MTPTSVNRSNYRQAISWVRFISPTIKFPLVLDGTGTISSAAALDMFLDRIIEDASTESTMPNLPGGPAKGALNRLTSLLQAIENSKANDTV